MGKPILSHTIVGNSFEELSESCDQWLDKMRGKIEILEMRDGIEKEYPKSFTIIYYSRDTIQVEFTTDELQYIAEAANDDLKYDKLDNKLAASVAGKSFKALGWK